jgi:hypothetical protein
VEFGTGMVTLAPACHVGIQILRCQNIVDRDGAIEDLDGDSSLTGSAIPRGRMDDMGDRIASVGDRNRAGA